MNQNEAMGFLTGREDYDTIVAKMRLAIDRDYAEGAEFARIARVGEHILREHVPTSHHPGDPCPRCEGESFPCRIMRDFVNSPG